MSLEHARMIIEEYCYTHNTKKSARLCKLVLMSYDLSAAGTDADSIYLEGAIRREKDLKLKETLIELDDFLFGW